NPKVKTNIVSNHVANSFCYVVIKNDELYDLQIFRGQNAAKTFIDSLIETCIKLREIPIVPINMTKENWNDFNNSKECSYCKKEYNNNENNLKVKDHDHFTGVYRQALC